LDGEIIIILAKNAISNFNKIILSIEFIYFLGTKPSIEFYEFFFIIPNMCLVQVLWCWNVSTLFGHIETKCCRCYWLLRSESEWAMCGVVWSFSLERMGTVSLFLSWFAPTLLNLYLCIVDLFLGFNLGGPVSNSIYYCIGPTRVWFFNGKPKLVFINWRSQAYCN
jgi:hypothetical protein